VYRYKRDIRLMGPAIFMYTRLNRRHALDSVLKPVQTFSMMCIKMQPRRNSHYFQGLGL